MVNQLGFGQGNLDPLTSLFQQLQRHNQTARRDSFAQLGAGLNQGAQALASALQRDQARSDATANREDQQAFLKQRTQFQERQQTQRNAASIKARQDSRAATTQRADRIRTEDLAREDQERIRQNFRRSADRKREGRRDLRATRESNERIAANKREIAIRERRAKAAEVKEARLREQGNRRLDQARKRIEAQSAASAKKIAALQSAKTEKSRQFAISSIQRDLEATQRIIASAERALGDFALPDSNKAEAQTALDGARKRQGDLFDALKASRSAAAAEIQLPSGLVDSIRASSKDRAGVIASLKSLKLTNQQIAEALRRAGK